MRDFLFGVRIFPVLLRNRHMAILLPAFFLLSVSLGIGGIAFSWIAVSESRLLPSSILLAAALAGGLCANFLGAALVKRVARSLRGVHMIAWDVTWRGTIWSACGLWLVSSQPFNDYVFLACVALGSLTSSWSRAGLASTIVEGVPEDQRLEANSWIASQSSIAMLVGPAVGGLSVAAVGAPRTVLLTGALLLVLTVGVVVVARALPPQAGATTTRDAGVTETSTSRTITSTPFLGALLLTTCFMALFYGFLQVALPLVFAARSGSSAGAASLGAMWSAFGLGALVGSFLSPLHRGLSIWMSALVTCVLWGLSITVLSFFAGSWAGVVTMAVAGLVYSPYTAVANTYIQSAVPRAELASVVAFWSAAVTVCQPAGVAVAGWLALRLDETYVIAISGIASILVGLVAFLTRTSVGRQASPAAHDAVSTGG